jgi:hypothetical protein
VVDVCPCGTDTSMICMVVLCVWCGVSTFSSSINEMIHSSPACLKNVLERPSQTLEHENHALEVGGCCSPGEKTLGERREEV